MDKPHLFLGNSIAEPIRFTPHNNGTSNLPPERNVSEHASFLREKYAQSIKTSKEIIMNRKSQGLIHSEGLYLDVKLEGDKIPLESLDGKRGTHLLNVEKTKDEPMKATVFLPFKNEDWLTKKIDKYEKPAEDGNNPTGKTLINSIGDINPSFARSLFPNKEEYDNLIDNAERLFEVWIDETEPENIQTARLAMDKIGLSVIGDNIITFESVTVFLVRALKEAIEDVPFSLDKVSAIKLYNDPSKMTIKNDEDQRDWVELISDNVSINLGENPVIVGLLDKGVNNGHVLLKDVLPDKRRASVVEGVGIGHEGFHGTCMAGLIEFGDLSKYQLGQGPMEVNHALASIKLLSDSHDNPPALYGKLTKEAIDISERFGAKIICMAVTENMERNDGTPSSWSASVDAALYNRGECDRLLFVSAGNTDLNNINPDNYIESLDISSMQSPSQALNAVSVGAYTEFNICTREGWTAIAPPQGISPMTRTSVMWKGKNPKPDIVMEGGNVAYHKILKAAEAEELSPVSTNHEIPQRPLRMFNMTSAATALASRLAAKIKAKNCELSALSVRALIIHSAEWTPQMKRLSDSASKIMEYCGYGVPQEERAIASSNTNATFIFENEIIPYKENSSYKEMHFYDLPWPKQLLESMEGENVRLRVTLSYYIQPSPGFKSTYNKYRYPSSSLTFDVKTPLETTEQFIARNNKNQQVKDKSENDADRWKIGIKRRSIGTVQSDWFECSARDLAECNQIGIFPGNGWWKNRKISNIDNRIKYSLVVSIETSETEIYNEVTTAIANRIGISIKS